MLQYMPERYSEILGQMHLKSVFQWKGPRRMLQPRDGGRFSERPADRQCYAREQWHCIRRQALGGCWLVLKGQVSVPVLLTPTLTPRSQGCVLRVRQQHPADQPGGSASALPLTQTHQRGSGAGAQRGRGRPWGRTSRSACTLLGAPPFRVLQVDPML